METIKKAAPASAPNKTAETILKAQGLIKRYPIGDREIEILHGLDLDVHPGEFVMLIGPSGCGKSTFMYILFGLELATQGTVSFRTQDIARMSDDERAHLRNREMSMVHQQPIWIKALTVKENIAFPLTLQQQSKAFSLKQAGRLLDVLNLGHLAEKHPNELSVGEQQRCSLMRSLIADPHIVFADEPTGSLDTDASIVVMELFKKINTELGKTIVMVTHNMSHLPYATKVVSMLDGTIRNVETKQPPSPNVGTSADLIDAVSSWREPKSTPTPTGSADQPSAPEKVAV